MTHSAICLLLYLGEARATLGTFCSSSLVSRFQGTLLEEVPFFLAVGLG